MITFHFERPQLPSWALELQLPWVKMLYPPEHDPWPGSRTIGRWPLGDGVEQDYILRGAEGAREYFWAMQDVYARAPWVWCWEGPNEPYVGDQEHRVMLSIFTYEWTRLMRDSGLRTAVYSLAEGNPEVLDAFGQPTDEYVMELALGLQNADYLALHEYSWPGMQDAQGWRCLRYRKTCEIWRRNGVRVPPILITETGIDGSTVGRGGWQDAGISEEDYIAQLAWYQSELERDGVECATVFTSAPNPRWASFEVTESLARKIYAMGVGTMPTPGHIEYDGRFMTRAEFVEHVRTVDMGAVDRVVIHHTFRPAEIKGRETLEAMKRQWEAQGWDSGPHVFVDKNGYWLFTPLSQDGTAVYGHNKHSRHVELVGDYRENGPDADTWRNAVIGTAAICRRIGLPPGGWGSNLWAHKELDVTTECPGSAMLVLFGDFKRAVARAIEQYEGELYYQVLGDYLQQYIIPQNPDAALYKEALARGLGGSICREIPHGANIAQVFYTPGSEWQDILFCCVGRWNEITHFRRKN